jgi:hypothetical protein
MLYNNKGNTKDFIKNEDLFFFHPFLTIENISINFYYQLHVLGVIGIL